MSKGNCNAPERGTVELIGAGGSVSTARIWWLRISATVMVWLPVLVLISVPVWEVNAMAVGLMPTRRDPTCNWIVGSEIAIELFVLEAARKLLLHGSYATEVGTLMEKFVVSEVDEALAMPTELLASAAAAI